MRRPGEEWLPKMDFRTTACLYDGGGVCNLTIPMDDKLRRAINEDTESEGGHRAVVLQGAEGTGRTTALRRFVELVAASCPDLPPPVVVARRVTWPGRMAVDLLCDVVTQLEALVNVADMPFDDDTGLPAFTGHQRVDLDITITSKLGHDFRQLHVSDNGGYKCPIQFIPARRPGQPRKNLLQPPASVLGV